MENTAKDHDNLLIKGLKFGFEAVGFLPVLVFEGLTPGKMQDETRTNLRRWSGAGIIGLSLAV